MKEGIEREIREAIKKLSREELEDALLTFVSFSSVNKSTFGEKKALMVDAFKTTTNDVRHVLLLIMMASMQELVR